MVDRGPGGEGRGGANLAGNDLWFGSPFWEEDLFRMRHLPIQDEREVGTLVRCIGLADWYNN